MSLASKLSITDVDVKGKRVLIRVCAALCFLIFCPAMQVMEGFQVAAQILVSQRDCDNGSPEPGGTGLSMII